MFKKIKSNMGGGGKKEEEEPPKKKSVGIKDDREFAVCFNSCQQPHALINTSLY